MDFDSFFNGTCFDAYEYLGAHFSDEQTTFRVCAPHAHHVQLILPWGEYPMTQIYGSGIFEAVIPQLWGGTAYEYRIYSDEWHYQDHCDPFGFGMDLRPEHRSIVRSLHEYGFSDWDWMLNRSDTQQKPVNIYEIHPGSFRRGWGDTPWLRYDELAYELIPYLQETGYNYVELMPLHEHPADGSWGYQPTGFFSPTSRYGTAAQLQKMVDLFHQAGIGVILDFLCVHFAVDEYGLALFDGTRMFEAGDGIREWGNYGFGFEKGVVRSFLQSCANYYLREFHFDGLRLDAVSRMIYHFGDPEQGYYQEALDFLRGMNCGLKRWHPSCILIAEDSTVFPGVTAPVDCGGLGFDYKWNLGWSHDLLQFLQLPPRERCGQSKLLTFAMEYAYSEHYLLPLSHDIAVSETVISRCWGNYDEKFAQIRTFSALTAVHPGKKLCFMGTEIGQFRPWQHEREQDWNLRSFPIHDSLWCLNRDLNHIYLNYPCLSRGDHIPDCFHLIQKPSDGNCIYAFSRQWEGDEVLCIFNFGIDYHWDFHLSSWLSGRFQVFLNTDWQKYGGGAFEERPILSPGDLLPLPAFSAVLLHRYY